MRVNILLANIGSPSDTTLPAVRKYLSQFLGDHRILPVKPTYLRNLLAKYIAYKRAPKILEQYTSLVASYNGKFPLMDIHNKLETLIQQAYMKTPTTSKTNNTNLENNWNTLSKDHVVKVRSGLAYSDFPIDKAMKELFHDGKIVVFPMFPQYCGASYGAVLEAVYANSVSPNEIIPRLHVVEPYYNHPAFIKSSAKKIQNTVSDLGSYDMVIMSYHSMPIKPLIKASKENIIYNQESTMCNPEGSEISKCCFNPNNTQCYKRHCLESSRLIAKELNLSDNQYITTFQSRLNNKGLIARLSKNAYSKWISPATISTVKDLANQNKKRVIVAAPSFTIDCLETTEELGKEVRDAFLTSGGEEYILVPSLNTESYWVDSIKEIIGSSIKTT